MYILKRKWKKYYTYPLYNVELYDHDIGIVELESEFTFSSDTNIFPVCLNTLHNADDFKDNLIFAGYGDQEKAVVTPDSSRKITTMDIIEESIKLPSMMTLKQIKCPVNETAIVICATNTNQAT